MVKFTPPKGNAKAGPKKAEKPAAPKKASIYGKRPPTVGMSKRGC